MSNECMKFSLAYRPRCLRKGAKHRLNIVKPSVKSRSRSVMVIDSGQGESWQMCV